MITLHLLACLLWFSGSVREEISRLAKLLDWHAGSAVADIGAGDGRYAMEAATLVGAGGLVYATEVDPKKLDRLRKKAKQQANLIVEVGTEAETGLPPHYCDAIFIRGVYHHFTNPSMTNASLYRALKPGGKLAVIDFPPQKLLSWFFPVHGVPENRGGHGIPMVVVRRELRDSGFEILNEVSEWPKGYCVVARKPAQDE